MKLRVEIADLGPCSPQGDDGVGFVFMASGELVVTIWAMVWARWGIVLCGSRLAYIVVGVGVGGTHVMGRGLLDSFSFK